MARYSWHCKGTRSFNDDGDAKKHECGRVLSADTWPVGPANRLCAECAQNIEREGHQPAEAEA